jgi:hypothetical protein
MKVNLIEWKFKLITIEKDYIVFEGMNGQIYTLHLDDSLIVGIPVDIEVQ